MFKNFELYCPDCNSNRLVSNYKNTIEYFKMRLHFLCCSCRKRYNAQCLRLQIFKLISEKEIE
jgi:hypothetical protein